MVKLTEDMIVARTRYYLSATWIGYLWSITYQGRGPRQREEAQLLGRRPGRCERAAAAGERGGDRAQSQQHRLAGGLPALQAAAG